MDNQLQFSNDGVVIPEWLEHYCSYLSVPIYQDALDLLTIKRNQMAQLTFEQVRSRDRLIVELKLINNLINEGIII